jgi:hypothetical protein
MVDLTSPPSPVVTDGPVNLTAGGNEWTDFVVQVDAANAAAIRLGEFKNNSVAAPPARIAVAAYQLVSVPVDLNNAEYVRHSGEDGQTRSVPRALLPLAVHDGIVDLPDRQAGVPLRLWFDLHVPANAPPGSYSATCELLDSGNRPIDSTAVGLAVDGFVLPDAPQLAIVGQIDWDTLVRLYPAAFETVMPRLVNRTDPQYALAVQVLDQLILLAHENHVELVVPRLQPTVKWAPGQIDWSDYDPLVSPWLKGDAFSDHVPLGYWPMPAPDFIDNFDPQSRSEYWHEAAEHFAQAGWLSRCPAVLHADSPGAVTVADTLILSAEARATLAAHGGLRVRLPLADDQLQLASAGNPNGVDPAATGALLTVSPGLVSAAALQPWPENVGRPSHWISADGCGDENDVRTWAALAVVRGASVICWDNPLPATDSLAQPTASNQLVWFYPGKWFGVDGPVETVQLKWLRQAQQDFEYFALARQHGKGQIAGQMAELIAKPVELAAGAQSDPTLDLICGISDSHAWTEARQLLATRVEKQDALDLNTVRWVAQQTRPTVLVRGVDWSWDNSADAGGHRLNARIDVDVYNPSDSFTDGGELQWSALQSGWEIRPQPVLLDKLPAGQVLRARTQARFDLNLLSAESDKPLELTLLGGTVGQTVACPFVAPVAASQRLRVEPIIDGSLDDWSAADAIQLDRPLVRMLNRPALQRQEFQSADMPASIYSGWSDDSFFLAFRLGGVEPLNVQSTRNFVDYQARRAWSEDLAEILIQPIYIDNSVGPTLHIVCKPAGNWTERKSAEEWQAFEGAGIRYASTVDPQQLIWRGEVAIPWGSITSSDRGRPSLLRFNFVQHRNSTGQSASWAGPIDYGRDNAMMGLIHLRDAVTPGLANMHP